MISNFRMSLYIGGWCEMSEMSLFFGEGGLDVAEERLYRREKPGGRELDPAPLRVRHLKSSRNSDKLHQN